MFRNTVLAFVAIAAVGCGKKEAEPIEPTPAEVSVEAQEDAEPTAPEVLAEPSADVAGEGDGATERTGRDRIGRRKPGEAGIRPGLPGLTDGGDVVREPGMRPAPVGRKPMPGMGEPAGEAPVGGPGEAGEPAKQPGEVVEPVPPTGEGDTVAQVGPGEPTVPTPGEPGRGPNPRTPAEPTLPAPEADKLLPVATVMENVKTKKLSPAGALPGIAIQPGYSSTFYASADGKSLGVSLQVWQDPARRESDDRFRRMRLQYPNAEDVNAMPPAKAFYAHFSGVQMLTFVDSVKRVVASVACGENVCDHQQLLKLARSIREKL